MRPLTDEEIAARDERRKAFIASYTAGAFFLTQLLEQLGVANPQAKLERLTEVVPLIAVWFSDVDIESNDENERLHSIALLTFFLGDLFVQKHDGRWLLDENPESPSFLHYVVGRFSGEGLESLARLDPAQAATEAFSIKPPLEDFIKSLEGSLRAAQ